MARFLKFANGSQVEYIDEDLAAIETEEYYNGSSRRTLTVQIEVGKASVDALNSLCTEENLAVLELVNTGLVDDNGETYAVTNIYEGYVLKLEVGIKPHLVSAETPDAPAVYEDRIVLKVGKRTYMEEQLHKLGLM